ncbi:hypothetical protein HM1_1183 [Heliomicrobium modesticaldum Ice1]|uniref:DUF4330 domain-containing protein n=1 Tax=Heliobacterium modesticaldum (strain ATCC 51547 / Ice1) TaxID=498761 RepID=B0THF3_HELMI|nr:DUF4330 domain-containing protein [Heliomicrobium modesticaldum]ABZ83391.1 hypothetical protein HM1_1183 [Heliomicrobium modesticaldum Ice1]
MKLVNEKGRLFGLINPLDLLILLAVIALVAGLATKTNTIVQTTETPVQFEVVLKRVLPEVAANLDPKEALVGGGSILDPQDVRVESLQVVPCRQSQPNDQGQLILTDDPYLKDVHLVIRGVSRSATADLRVGNQEIKAGKEYYYKTQKTQLIGTVTKVSVLK